ncbi:MAG: hypothetical protein WCH31_05185 [Actinomycetes bacterium]|jgi:hypothetical protein
MISRVVDVDLARLQWIEGRRRVGRAAPPHVWAQIDLITSALSRRVGQVFTLQDLADTYSAADGWTLDLLYDATPEGTAPPEVAMVADAAFHDFSRRAADYEP